MIPALRRARRELVDDLAENRERVRGAQRDDLGAALELGEEEDLVDQLAGVLDLGARLLEKRRDVGVGQVGGVEQDEDARERRSELVGDRGREPGAQLVERHVLDDSLVLRVGDRQLFAVPRARSERPFCEKASSPDRHHFVTGPLPCMGLW